MENLIKKKAPPFVVSIIAVMFRRSRVSVQYDRVFSNKWNLNRGVRQGGIFSAFLFCVYIDDILVSFENNYNGSKLGINLINGIAYADDLVFLAPTAAGLQSIVNDVGNRIADLGLATNVRKTVCMVFRPKPFLSDHLNFTLNDKRIAIVNSVKYLGCILTSDFNDMCDY